MQQFDSPSEFVGACVNEVARELARATLSPDPNSEQLNERLRIWHENAAALKPEAIEKIKAMNGYELLELIGEVLCHG